MSPNWLSLIRLSGSLSLRLSPSLASGAQLSGRYPMRPPVLQNMLVSQFICFPVWLVVSDSPALRMPPKTPAPRMSSNSFVPRYSNSCLSVWPMVSGPSDVVCLPAWPMVILSGVSLHFSPFICLPVWLVVPGLVVPGSPHVSLNLSPWIGHPVWLIVACSPDVSIHFSPMQSGWCPALQMSLFMCLPACVSHCLSVWLVAWLVAWLFERLSSLVSFPFIPGAVYRWCFHFFFKVSVFRVSPICFPVWPFMCLSVCWLSGSPAVCLQ